MGLEYVVWGLEQGIPTSPYSWYLPCPSGVPTQDRPARHTSVRAQPSCWAAGQSRGICGWPFSRLKLVSPTQAGGA